MNEKHFCKINENRAVEFGLNNQGNWYADLIDFNEHKKIATLAHDDKAKVIADIVNDNWFDDNLVNFARFIDHVLG